jgi:MFS family permease
MIEGFVYLGTLPYLAMFFNQYVKLSDKHAGWMVGVMTAGITFSMLFFGSRVDSWGLRRTLFTALGLMLLGRTVLAIAPSLGMEAGSLFSTLNMVSVSGILLVVVGYGMYQPAIYAGTRAITTAVSSGMAFAMLYAVMNLGGWLPTFMSPIRRAFGIDGALGFFAISSALGTVALALLLTKKTLDDTLRKKNESQPTPTTTSERKTTEYLGGVNPVDTRLAITKVANWLKNHPLANPKFTFFIFSLIPAQTLFAYNWFILPQYVARAFAKTWIGNNFETATSLNSLLIFILCPIVAALSVKAKVYNMMVLGTAVMAMPAFLLALGPTVPGLFGYILVLSIGEAMWQPRFLQYAAEIAPEGRTGAYMGVAQFPWFLTKMIVPLYSGITLTKWCPAQRPTATGTMWLVFGCIAIATPILLFGAKRWVGKDFRTKAG